MLNPDFRDMLSAFSGGGVEFLVVGAYAMAAHGYVRATGDMDLWVRPSLQNAERVLRALSVFGAPVGSLTAADFEDPDVVVQIGLPPRRIDVLTTIDGVAFDEAVREAIMVEIESLRIPVLSRTHLIANKESTGRPKDRLDAQALRDLEPPSRP